MFDCLSVRFPNVLIVQLANVLGEFDQVRLPNPVEVSQTIGVRLDSITERSISYSLSQNFWDTFVSPYPLNVGVQGLVTEPR